MIFGEYDAAIQELEAAWPVPGVYAWKLRSDSLYAPLRGNPRFQKLAAWRPPQP